MCVCVCGSRARLNLPLFPPIRILAKACKQNIVANLWPSNQALSVSIDDFDGYFEYYNQCRNRDPVDPVDPIEQTQLDIVDIAQHINSNVNSSLFNPRDSLQRACPRCPNDQPQLSNLIELTVRSWLMIEVQNLRPGDYRTLRTA